MRAHGGDTAGPAGAWRKEAQLDFLLRLSDALRHLDDVGDIQTAVARMVVTALRAGRVGFVDAANGGDDVVVCCEVADGAPGFEWGGRAAVLALGMSDRLRAGEMGIFPDVANDVSIGDAQRCACAESGIAAAVNVPPLKVGGPCRFLFVHYPVRHAFRAGEIELLRETAERVWFAIDAAHTKAALRTSKAQLVAALESVPAGIAMLDRNGRIVVANSEYRRFLPNGVIPSQDPTVQDRWRAWNALGEPLSVDHYPGARAMRGEPTVPGQDMLFSVDAEHHVWTRVASIPIYDDAGRISGQASVISDIDALKRGAEALRESEARAQLLIDGIAKAVWEAAPDGLFEIDSPSWRAFTGEAFGEWKGRGWLDAVHPDDRLSISQQWRDTVAHQRPLNAEARLRAGDGSYRWMNVRAIPLRDGGGRLVKWLGMNIDIDDRQQLQQSLRHSERRTRALIEGIPQLLWQAAHLAEWRWASSQWTAFTGQSEVASRGRGWLAMVHPDDRPGMLAAWARAEAERGFEVEHRLRRHDGCFRWFVTQAVPVCDDGGSILEWLGAATDIDAMRQAQARQDVLVAELQHRTRNLIAVVRALAEKTLDGATTLAAFENRFNDRLSALGRVQGLLSHASAGRKVTFDELLRSELSAMGAGDLDERIALQGPRGVPLRSRAVQTLALALHELATNAVKHGALAQSSGKLMVNWSIANRDAGGRELLVDWRETGIVLARGNDGRPREGYGRELIEHALPFQLGAKTSYILDDHGLRCTIRVPIIATPDEERE